MIEPGAVYLRTSYRLHNGESGEKVMVALGHSDSKKDYLLARATVEVSHMSVSPGANPNDRPPNFFFPRGTSVFRRETWVCLDDFYVFPASYFDESAMGKSLTLLGVIGGKELAHLQTAATLSEDISRRHIKMIKNAQK